VCINVPTSELKRQLETEESGTNYDRVRQYRIGVSTYERPNFLSQQGKRNSDTDCLDGFSISFWYGYSNISFSLILALMSSLPL
jgi:hypothetical protein